MADPAAMNQLAQLLAQTVAGNTQVMQGATQQLAAAEVKPGFGLMLLELLRSSSIDGAARQAGAIYFKNYVRRQWSKDASVGGIAVSDRQAIKDHLLGLMLQAPKPVQVQLAAGLEEISVTDYPAEWQSLLPQLVEHLKASQDMGVLKGTMETANTVFLKFRSRGRSNELLKEIKYTVQGFQEIHLTVFKATCQRLLAGGVMPPDQVTAHFELLNSTIGVFYSLNVVDLPEFFEDHRQDYFNGFLELLKYHSDVVAGQGDQPGLLEQVKGSVCEAFALYTDKYQEEFSPFLMPCVEAVWKLLVGVGPEEKNDQLVAKGIHFLSSAASTQWQTSPFQDAAVLSGICEKVVFPNIMLRQSDIELFQDNPVEYVRKDMEGADLESRRRSAVDLVKAMGKFNDAQVTEILLGYVRTLIGQAQQGAADQAERFKDACVYLCIAISVRGQTQREGVTVTNANVNVADIFSQLIGPNLVAEPLTNHPVLRASTLKFVTVFRSQLSREQIGMVLPAICALINSESPVVHSYAAICIEKLLSVKDKNPQGQAVLRYDPATMRASLLQIVEPMLKIIMSGKGIPQNEYIMRAVAKIFSFLKQQGAEAGLQMLQPLAAILVAHAANPSNPVFNHNLFEAIASIVKVCAPSQPDAVENALLPSFRQIIDQNVADFLPYTFQILGLLLDATSSVKPLYQELFAMVLNPEMWRSQGNVPGLVRLLRAYFCKHAFFTELLKSRMQEILERFRCILLNKKTEPAAFEFLIAMYMHLPLDFYQQHFKALMTVLLVRLQANKNPRFQKDFVVSSSLFLHRQQGQVLPAVLNEIQQGLLGNLLTSVWREACNMSLKLDERKICTVAMCRLVTLEEFASNPQALNCCCTALVNLLGLTPSTKVAVVDDASDDEEPMGMGAEKEFEASFNKLRNTDLPGAAAGMAPDVADLPSVAKALLAPRKQTIVQLAQANAELGALGNFVQ